MKYRIRSSVDSSRLQPVQVNVGPNGEEAGPSDMGVSRNDDNDAAAAGDGTGSFSIDNSADEFQDQPHDKADDDVCDQSEQRSYEQSVEHLRHDIHQSLLYYKCNNVYIDTSQELASLSQNSPKKKKKKNNFSRRPIGSFCDEDER